MLFDRRMLFALALLGIAMTVGANSAHAQISERDQVIDGTQVHTRINHDQGLATFSNECGSQVLTQDELRNGAKPTDIIPCNIDATSPNSKSGKDCLEVYDALIEELDFPPDADSQSSIKTMLAGVRNYCSKAGLNSKIRSAEDAIGRWQKAHK